MELFLYNNEMSDDKSISISGLRGSFLKELMIATGSDSVMPNIKIALFNDKNGLNENLLYAKSVSCDTNLKNLLLSELHSPIGLQKNVLLRMTDVIYIEHESSSVD